MSDRTVTYVEQWKPSRTHHAGEIRCSLFPVDPWVCIHTYDDLYVTYASRWLWLARMRCVLRMSWLTWQRHTARR